MRIMIRNNIDTAATSETERLIVSDEDRAAIKDGLQLLQSHAVRYAELKGLGIHAQPDLIARLLHLCEESAELAQAFREGNPPADQLPGFLHAEEEAADVLAVLLMIVSATGCRLGDAFIEKLESCSASRQFLHGKRW